MRTIHASKYLLIDTFLSPGLDFEISTYQKLLEGEEFRLQSVPPRITSGGSMSLRKVVEEYESAYKSVS